MKPTPEAVLRRRVAISSYLGTTLEYYDFLLYGATTALVLNRVFFSDLAPWLGTVVALATLAAGYLARFVGAVLFGHLGDRLGRKRVLTATMVTMGVSSGLIGLLPDHASIGVAAPLLLVTLRLIQGLAAGGEYGGAVLMTSEYAVPGRRALFSSAATMGVQSGALLATGAVTLVATLDDPALLSWGWRVPFLASFGLVAVGLWFRARIEESPVFLASVAITDVAPRSPLAEVVRRHGGRIGAAVLAQLAVYAGSGVFGVFLLSYAPTIGQPPSLALVATLLGQLIAMVLTPVVAALSDPQGRRPLLRTGTVGTAVLAFPLLWMVDSGSGAALLIAVAFYLGVVVVTTTAVAPVLLVELLPTEMRFTGVAVGYQAAVTLGVGFSPLAAAALVAIGGGTAPVAVLLVALAVVSTVAVRRLPETAHTSLTARAEPGREPGSARPGGG